MLTLFLHDLKNIDFENITPDKNNNWINNVENDWDLLIPFSNEKNKEKKIFHQTSLGVSTNRDEWVYDFDISNLENKMNHFISTFNNIKSDSDNSIKWSSTIRLGVTKVTTVPRRQRNTACKKIQLCKIKITPKVLYQRMVATVT